MRKIKYIVNSETFSLIELKDMQTVDGRTEGSLTRITMPIEDLMDIIQAITTNNKSLLVKTQAKGEVEIHE